jgi:threonine dehydratase
MKKKGVVAASAGNHAQGVAWASSLLGIHSTIVMPEGVSLAKQMATQSYGGEILLFGQNTDEPSVMQKIKEVKLVHLLMMSRSLQVRERSASKF